MRSNFINKKYYKLLWLVSIFFLLPTFSFMQPPMVAAQMSEELPASEETLEGEFTDEEFQLDDESLVNENSAVEAAVDPNLFNTVLPYAKFLNYQYIGDGIEFTTKDIIMEYAPDNNGVFQVAEFTENKAVAFIYQVRSNGLYELAFFDDYNVVQDMRYTLAATDGSESLILPADLKAGNVFQSGYQKEKVRTIIGTADLVQIGEESYSNVLIMEEISTINGQERKLNYYLAPDYGIILVEEVHLDGTRSNLMYLNSVQGPLN